MLIRLLINGLPQALVVIAVLAGCGQSKLSDPSIVPPDGLEATAGPGQVALVWPEISNSAFYVVYWDSNQSVTRTDSSVVSLVPSVTITDLTNGVEYFFAVGSVSISGVVGSLSEAVSAIPLPNAPDAPTGLSALAGSGEVTLSWTAVTGADSYKIFYNTTGGVKDSDASIDVEGGTTATYTHTGLQSLTTYYYRIAAVNTGGQSALSDEVFATLP